MDLGSPGSGISLTLDHESRVEDETGPHTPKGPVKRHKCPKPGCGKSFSRPSHLARHALNHSATEFRCSRCRASFKRRDLLGESDPVAHDSSQEEAIKDARRLIIVFRAPQSSSCEQGQASWRSGAWNTQDEEAWPGTCGDADKPPGCWSIVFIKHPSENESGWCRS
jgi:hypothetical protein